MTATPAPSGSLVLLECLVAGTSHRDNLVQYEPELYVGQPLLLSRGARQQVR
jgi:hypothetical protein